MPPKEKKAKKPRKKRVPRKRTIARIAELPRLATGANRDIPLGGAGGSSNLLAALAARPPPPATPIQTPDQFQIMREQSRQAKVIDLVEEEQRAVRRQLNKDGTPDMRYLQNRIPPAMPVGDMEMPRVKEEPLDEMPAFTEPTMLSGNIRLTKKGTPDRRFRQGGTGMTMGDMNAPPVIGTGATYAGGAPVVQQGLRMGMDGRLSGVAFDNLELENSIGDQTVFMG